MVVATVILYTAAAVEYVRLTWQRRVNPVPATWILMFTVFSLSIWMYFTTAKHTLAGNIGNTAGFLNVCLIFAGVIGLHLKDGTLRLAFSSFQKKCLAGGALIAMFWLLTKNSWAAYLLTQALALVAYLPTVHRLWHAQRNTESLFLWGSVLLACLTALYPAIVLRDALAWVYLGRAIPSTIIVVALILRLKRREAAQLRIQTA